MTRAEAHADPYSEKIIAELRRLFASDDESTVHGARPIEIDQEVDAKAIDEVTAADPASVANEEILDLTEELVSAPLDHTPSTVEFEPGSASSDTDVSATEPLNHSTAASPYESSVTASREKVARVDEIACSPKDRTDKMLVGEAPSQAVTADLQHLLAYCAEHGRVCPVPQQWLRLWDVLPNKRLGGAGWEPSLPLILGAWWEASDEEKQERLAVHLRWAAEHDALGQVEQFLRSLPKTEWHRRGDNLEKMLT
jgi:hypothetical protein